MSSSSTRVFEPQDQDQPSKAEPAIQPAPDFIHNRPALARHRRKCCICRHPERDTIEDLFIHWHSPSTIANFFDDAADDAEDAGDDSAGRLRITWVAIYRHAYAVGLDEIRRRNLRFAFEHILEQAGDITPTSASIMAAARAYAACVNPDGHWNDPPKQVIVTNILKRETPLTDHPASAEPSTVDSSASATALGVIPNPAAPGSVSSQNKNGADVGEGSAVALVSAPPRIPASDSLAVAPLAEDGSPNESGILASAPPRIPASDSLDDTPPTHCHSERGCDQHPTRNLHFGPSPQSDAEIRIPSNSLITNDREISNR